MKWTTLINLHMFTHNSLKYMYHKALEPTICTREWCIITVNKKCLRNINAPGAKFKKGCICAMKFEIGGSTNKMLVRVLSAWFDGKISDDSFRCCISMVCS